MYKVCSAVLIPIILSSCVSYKYRGFSDPSFSDSTTENKTISLHLGTGQYFIGMDSFLRNVHEIT